MLRLELMEELKIPVEAPKLKPDVIVNCYGIKDVEYIPVHHGNEDAYLGDFFKVSGEIDDSVLIEGDLRKVKRIGEGMSQGSIEIHGDVGMHLAKDMSGGKVFVDGNVSDWMASGMSGGIIRVNGSVGNFACASYWGEKGGMSGGVVFINGSAGADLGRRMRRGIVFVSGSVGKFVGVDVIAGTIFVMGEAAEGIGAGMKRGSIVLYRQAGLLPSFLYSGEFKPYSMLLYSRYLGDLFQLELPLEFESGYFRRYMGDFLSLGKGEILVWSH